MHAKHASQATTEVQMFVSFVMVAVCIHKKHGGFLLHASSLNLNHYHHTTTIKYIIAGAITSYHIIKLLFKMTDHS